MVDRVCLENRSARKGTGGSNPSLSANAAREAGEDTSPAVVELAPNGYRAVASKAAKRTQR